MKTNLGDLFLFCFVLRFILKSASLRCNTGVTVRTLHVAAINFTANFMGDHLFRLLPVRVTKRSCTLELNGVENESLL